MGQPFRAAAGLPPGVAHAGSKAGCRLEGLPHRCDDGTLIAEC